MRSSIHAAAAAALLLLLGACADGGDPAVAPPAPPAALDLCVSSSCGEKIELLDLPAAENLIFAPDGRLFVSAGAGVVQVTRDAGGAWAATPVSDASCSSSLGLAIGGDVLYAVCSGGIYAGRLTSAPALTRIFDLVGMCLANGMALGADGNLYVVDEPLSFCVPEPKIVKLIVDPADPLRIVAQEPWVTGSALGQLHLGLDNVLRFPNGVQSRGASFFGTDGGSVFRVDLNPDGSAGEVIPLFWEATAHDDLGIAGDDLIVTDFFGGRLLLLSQAGELLQETARLLWVGPSSARLGQPPLFEPGDIVVTEQGILGDQNLPLDKLSVFRRTSP